MVVLPLLAILAAMAILAPTLVSAADSGGPPRVDIRATCRAAERDIKKLFGNDTLVTFDACLNQENNALARLVKDWATYPAADQGSGRRRLLARIRIPRVLRRSEVHRAQH